MDNKESGYRKHPNFKTFQVYSSFIYYFGFFILVQISKLFKFIVHNKIRLNKGETYYISKLFKFIVHCCNSVFISCLYTISKLFKFIVHSYFFKLYKFIIPYFFQYYKYFLYVFPKQFYFLLNFSKTTIF